MVITFSRTDRAVIRLVAGSGRASCYPRYSRISPGWHSSARQTIKIPARPCGAGGRGLGGLDEIGVVDRVRGRMPYYEASSFIDMDGVSDASSCNDPFPQKRPRLLRFLFHLLFSKAFLVPPPDGPRKACGERVVAALAGLHAVLPAVLFEVLVVNYHGPLRCSALVVARGGKFVYPARARA